MTSEGIVLIGIKADWHLEQVGSDGRTVAIRDEPNLVVDIGKNRLTTLSFATASTVDKFGWTAIGSATAAPAAGDTALGGEKNRVVNTFTKNATVGECQMSSSHTGVTATISEGGLFSTNTAGTMFNRATFSTLTLSSGDTLNVVVTVSFT